MGTHAEVMETSAVSGPGTPRPPGGSRLSPLRLTALALAGTVLAGVALRGYHLSARSFWFDEAFSWRLTEFPFPDMLHRITLDNSPPLYYLLLKAWAGVFGTSALSLRSLSVLFGAASIVGMYLFASEAFRHDGPEGGKGREAEGRGRRVGLLAAALVALSAFQIRWATEVRMYTLGTALVAFSSWTLFRALHATSRARRWWILYGFITLLFAYTHNYALFSIAAQALFLAGFLLVRSGGSLRRLFAGATFWHALLAANILAVGWLPWLPFFLRMRAQVQTSFWTWPLTRWDLPHLCYQMFVEPEDVPLDRGPALVAATLCVLGLPARLWRARAGEWYVFCAGAIPFLLSVLVSTFDTRCFGHRYFLFAHLFLLAGLANLLCRVPVRLERAIGCASVLAWFLGVHVSYWQGLDIPHKPGARAAAEFITSERQTGELAVVSSPLLYFTMRYHAPDRSDWHMYNDGHGVLHYEGAAITTAEDLIIGEELKNVRCRRVWVVDMDGGHWGRRVVPVPAGWRYKSQKRFPEVYRVSGDILVTEYETAARAER